jgi:hypothetical protein
MREAVDVTRGKHEAAAELKRVLPQFVLMMTGVARPLSCLRIVGAQKMKEISGFQLRGPICLLLLIDQKRKGDGGLFQKLPRINRATKTNRGEGRSFVSEGLIVFAQLRDVLAAKNSSVVAQKDNDCRLLVPQRAEPDFAAVAVRQSNERQFAAERIVHGGFILWCKSRSVKELVRVRVSWRPAARKRNCPTGSSLSQS